MSAFVQNKICVFNEMELRYQLDGEIPSACRGGALVRVFDEFGEVFRIPIPDGVGTMQPVHATSSPRTFAVGDHIATIEITEVNEKAFQPYDLTLNTIPRLTPPLPSPCMDGLLGGEASEEPDGEYDFLRDFDMNDRFNLWEIAYLLLTIKSGDIDFPQELARKKHYSVGGLIIEGYPVTDEFGSGILLIHNDAATMVFIYGTTTVQQGLDQGRMMLGGPNYYGEIGYGFYWKEGANLVRDFLVEKLPAVPLKRLILIGHSMGGAVASTLGVFLKLNGFAPPIEIVTFGSPKPGDQHFMTYLKEKIPKRMHIENENDIIPYLFVDLLAIPGGPRTKLLVARSQEWQSYPDHVLLTTEGVLIRNGTKKFLPLAAVQAMELIINDEHVPITGSHIMLEYAARLLRRTPRFRRLN